MAEGRENIELDNFGLPEGQEYEYDDFREADPFYTTDLPQVDRLTQQRIELTNQEVDRYIREMNITNEAAKTNLHMNAKIGPDGKLYYNDIRLEKLTGEGFLVPSSLKGKGVAEFKRNVLDAPPEDTITEVLSHEDVINLNVPVEDMTPRNIGTLRDELTLLRTDASGNADKIQGIEDRIEEWNNLNPEYRAFVDELGMANKSLAELYAERDKILSPGPDGMEPPDLTPELREQLAKVDNRIEFFHDQRTVVYEKMAQTRSLREVISDPDLSLKLKLMELFRRKGLTIAAIITALGMTVTAIALSVRGGGSGSGTGKPGADSGSDSSSGPKEIVKQFGEWLKTLAAKSAAAIPGLIGTIVSFILRSAGSVVGFIGEQLWIFLTALTFFVVNRITQ